MPLPPTKTNGSPLTLHPLAALARLLVEKGILTEAEYDRALITSATCPSCRTMHSAFFNPQTMQIQMNIAKAQPAEQVPS